MCAMKISVPVGDFTNLAIGSSDTVISMEQKITFSHRMNRRAFAVSEYPIKNESISFCTK